MARAGLRGSPELRARLRAIKLSFKPIGKSWADETARRAKVYAPRRTGKGMKSIRRKNATQRKATVYGIWYLRFVDRGTKPHTIRPKSASGSQRGGKGTARMLRFQTGGQTIFAKQVRHPGIRRRMFALRASREALRRHPMAQTLIDEWNKAA